VTTFLILGTLTPSLLAHSSIIAIAFLIPYHMFIYKDMTRSRAKAFVCASLTLLTLFFQLPSIIVYLWNLLTYRELQAPTDAFTYTNHLYLFQYLIHATPYTLDFLHSTNSEKVLLLSSSLKLLFSLLGLVQVLLAVWQNPFYFYQTFENLGAICVCILGFTLKLRKSK